jgi:eukaryotic-like serine/threonine-protein kinase
MPVKVVLTITNGQLSGKRHVFEEHTVCVLGRHKDCNIRLPSDAEHAQVSRYHCLLDISPPAVRVRDLGSGNGTYVNSKRVGTSNNGANLLEQDLVEGDLLQVGYTVFAVSIEKTQAPNDPLVKAPYQPPSNREAADKLLAMAAGDHPNLSAISGYTIVKPLGTGKCGAVYLVQNDATKDLVALKVMLPQVAVNERAVSMFVREMSNTQALQHPNVVRTIDYGESNSIFYFTMECCHDGNVSDFIEKNGGKVPVKIA